VPARSVLIVDDSAAIRKALCEFFTASPQISKPRQRGH
jgi:chemotaxis response regulator CheB